jgi:hypothetical protein
LARNECVCYGKIGGNMANYDSGGQGGEKDGASVERMGVLFKNGPFKGHQWAMCGWIDVSSELVYGL